MKRNRSKNGENDRKTTEEMSLSKNRIQACYSGVWRTNWGRDLENFGRRSGTKKKKRSGLMDNEIRGLEKSFPAQLSS